MTEALRDHDRDVRADQVETGGRPLGRLVDIQDQVTSKPKFGAPTAARTSITPAEAELIGDYNLYNG